MDKKNKGIIQYYSWDLIDENLIVKRCDKSFFYSNGSAIPKELKWFFNCSNMDSGDNKYIELFYLNKVYQGRIVIDQLGRARIFWSTALGNEFKKIFEEYGYYPQARFQRVIGEVSELGGQYLEKGIYSILFTHDIEDKNVVLDHIKAMDYSMLETIAKKTENINPIKREVITTQIVRSQYIAELAKRNAHGKCQLCNQPAPFDDKDGCPYLETHHIIWLSKGGSDSIENTVALCPNCHKRMHIVRDKNDIEYLKKLKQMK